MTEQQRPAPASPPRPAPAWAEQQPCGLHLVLVAPEIPPNTGSVARLAAGTGATLHLVEPLGFSLDDRYLKRAGLDYWDSVRLERHASFEDYLAATCPTRFFLFHTRSARRYTDAGFLPGDHLIFGCESKGLPRAILERYPEAGLSLPSLAAIRSYNLANSVAIALFEALRQIAWEPGEHPGGYEPGKETVAWRTGKGRRVAAR